MSQRISFKVFFMALILAAVFMPTFAAQVPSVAFVALDMHSQGQVDLAVRPNTQSGAPAASNMLQFKAGGHIVGFQTTKAYLVGLDHALSVEFLGTPGVQPRTTGETESANQGDQLPCG